MTKIHCDESGFTGNHLLDAQQPYFVYASTNISNSDAVILLEHLKKEFSIQASEIKAATLMRRNDSERIARHVLEAVAGKCIISFYDKKYCLCTKLFPQQPCAYPNLYEMRKATLRHMKVAGNGAIFQPLRACITSGAAPIELETSPEKNAGAI